MFLLPNQELSPKMRFSKSPITAIVTIGLLAFTTLSAPAPQWRHFNKQATRPQAPAPVSSPAPSVTPATSSSDSSSGSESSSSSSTSSGGSGTPGQATVVNKCSFPTYVYVCKQHPATCGSNTTMAANSGGYSEAYAPASDGGHSLKISKEEGSGDILQLEYTNEGDGFISYDLSEVNGNPFGPYGFTLTNTTTDAYCAPPATVCPAIFTDPTNGIPYTAPTSAGVGVILCG
ncbi:hypothetical protein BDR22DRAFT_487770 [Usnea florida]